MSITHINWQGNVKVVRGICSAWVLQASRGMKQAAELGGTAFSSSDTDLVTTDIFDHYCMSHNCSQTKTILFTTNIYHLWTYFQGFLYKSMKVSVRSFRLNQMKLPFL